MLKLLTLWISCLNKNWIYVDSLSLIKKKLFFVWIHQFIWLHILTFHIHMNIYVHEIYAHNWKGEIRIPKYKFHYGTAHKCFVARVFTKHTPKRYAVSIILWIYGVKWYIFVCFDMVLHAFMALSINYSNQFMYTRCWFYHSIDTLHIDWENNILTWPYHSPTYYVHNNFVETTYFVRWNWHAVDMLSHRKCFHICKQICYPIFGIFVIDAWCSHLVLLKMLSIL